MMSDMVLVSLISASAGVFGAVAGAASGFLIAWHSNRISERKHAREHVTRAAIEYWAKHNEMLLSRHSGTVGIWPLDTYLIHVAAVSRAVFDETLSPENVVARLREAHAVSKAAQSFVKENSPAAA